MAISSRRASVSRLRLAIDAYRGAQKDRLDQPALALLDCLAGSSEAANAFERLKLKDRSDEAGILITCIDADDLACTFPQRILKAEKTKARMLRLLTPAFELLSFVAELIDEERNPPPFDLLSARIYEPAANISTMWDGLNLLVGHLSTKWTSAKEDVLRLGATKKKFIKQAGENAAIGWLAEGVFRVTGRPHYRAVRDLAEVILKIELDDLERVRRCARVRKREWRTQRPMVRPVIRPSPESKSLRNAIEAAKRRARPT